MHVEALNLARGPFAMTAIFHILWPILTMSLSSFAARSLLSSTGDHLPTRFLN
jgi:cytochrome bd-type quinol oxidase subunit 1